MTHPSVSADFLAQARADTLGRTRRHAEQCVLLALVTTADVAATLIDQAIALRGVLAPGTRGVQPL